jgi:hypothetical protein
MTSVINYYRKLDGHVKDVYYDSFSMGMSFKTLDEKMDWLLTEKRFKTIVGATLTSYIHIVLAHIIESKVGSKKGKSIGDIKVNSIEDYNAEDAAIIFELIGFMMELKQKGTNVILEAHVTPIEYRPLEGDSYTVLETLTKGKKAPASIPGYFDEVYYFEKKNKGIVVGMGETVHTMKTADPVVDCKSSRGVTGFEWTNKDFSEILMKQIAELSKGTIKI